MVEESLAEARRIADDEGACGPRICEVGGRGFLKLPWGGDDEQRWHPAVRIPLYLIALGWCFLGVAIIADVFMGAIEHITSKKVRKFNQCKNRYVTVLVWNPTVANLTLMALGSSAPEILLSVIELLGNEFFSGGLGPSTIVGSAAFNLFVIIAVCICAIPEGEVRRIKEMPVYCITAAWSILAYLWLLVILGPSSPNVVEPWEGVTTFLFFPLLVFMAYLADLGYFSKKKKAYRQKKNSIVDSGMTKEELAQVETHVRQSYGLNLSEDQVTKIIDIEFAEAVSRAKYRVAATRAITGGKRVRMDKIHRAMSDHLSQAIHRFGSMGSQSPSKCPNGKKKKIVPEDGSGCRTEEPPSPKREKCVLEFAVLKYAVLENAGFRRVQVTRQGDLDHAAFVSYRTREGTAKAGDDFTHTEGRLTFGPRETGQEITVSIVDDLAYEDDEEFYIDLFDPAVDGEGGLVELGTKKTVTLVIIDDDLPGTISFPEDQLHVQEAVVDRTVDLVVQRSQGCTGKVSVRYYSEDDTAKAGIDYEPLEGTIHFEPGETATSIKCKIMGTGRYERKEMFRVYLADVTGGAKFDAETDGGKDNCILSVFIESEGQVAKARIDRIMSKMQTKWEHSRIGRSNWRDQFREALYVNGGDDDDDEELSPSLKSDVADPPTLGDYAMHVITLPWKVLFAFVPPTDYYGGWLCFGCSLGMIALVTAVIGDMAGLLGCVLTIPDEVTAITFVALGTSLPDTFASKTAALQDPHADAAIGNVTGSNSVNVFLGLGLPWTIGSIYWSMRDATPEWISKYADVDLPESFRSGAFVVKAGTLAFSVSVFACCAVTAMTMLYLRRRLVGGELGGPRWSQMLSSGLLVALWILYVSLSSWYALKERTCT